MIALFVYLLAAGTTDVTDKFQHEWQSCMIETSKLWASKPGSLEVIADAASIYCREKLERFLIANESDLRSAGLDDMQANELNSFTAGILLRMNRGFATDAVVKAREGRKAN